MTYLNDIIPRNGQNTIRSLWEVSFIAILKIFFMMLGKTAYFSKKLWEDEIIYLISEEAEMH